MKTFLTLCLLGIFLTAAAQDRRGPPHQPQPVAITTPLDVIFGRPTRDSIRLHWIRHRGDGALELRYGSEDQQIQARLALPACALEQPCTLDITHLDTDREYSYAITEADSVVLRGRFHTARKPGQAFHFTVVADSHLDQNSDVALYRQQLERIRHALPDFHIDLGDTFMTDKHPDRASAERQYYGQRHLFSIVGQSVPLYLVLGNHDGEDARGLRDPQASGTWARQMRQQLFANPVPDGFYLGSAHQDYYAWQWGDAQFIVLNPYSYGSGGKGKQAPWSMSLGIEQYHWLQQVMDRHPSRYRFVFIHQLVGGRDNQGRGGMEAAGFGEWGGQNADGTAGFVAQRPGWPMPVHALLKKYGVTAVFHGHDHVYACQRLDDIAYVEVPQPARTGNGPDPAQYGYQSGDVGAPVGYVDVEVGRDQAIARLMSQGNVARVCSLDRARDPQ